jgi:hypothetical protein
MITNERGVLEPTAAVAGLPPDTVVERSPLADGGVFEFAAAVPPAAEEADHDTLTAELVGRATSWVQAATPGGDPPLVVPLYGTHVIWTPRRAVALGPADRLAALRTAVHEFTDREAELRDVERRIAAGLEHVDADAPLAFAFDEQALPRRRELAARFADAIAVRRRLAVLAPVLQRPAPHPPTLASQLGERLRDRSRVVDRLDHAGEQADLLERVYSGCGDRVAEFVSSRRHAALEWVIILLLAVEIVLITVDLLATHAR